MSWAPKNNVLRSWLTLSCNLGEFHHSGRRRHSNWDLDGLLWRPHHPLHGPGHHPGTLGRPWHRLPLLPHRRDLPHVRHLSHHLLRHHHEELCGEEHFRKLKHDCAKRRSHDRQLCRDDDLPFPRSLHHQRHPRVELGLHHLHHRLLFGLQGDRRPPARRHRQQVPDQEAGLVGAVHHDVWRAEGRSG